MAKLDYAASGVNREAGDLLVKKIGSLTRSTLNKKVKNSIGGYASVYELSSKQWIAASTDGVGTKLKLAFELGIHHTVGIDLVAMSVNDLLCVGATPLFFLDYFATGKLDRQVAAKVIEGIVEGCLQAKCALVGGETAEMPDFYASGEYDLGGFAVGSLTPKELLPKKKLMPGLTLIGLSSSGFHSNGFSLLRRLAKKGTQTHFKKKLLTPTRIYVKSLMPLLAQNWVEGMAHITGSGFLNVPRMSEKISYEIQLPTPAQQRAAGQKITAELYEWVARESQLDLEELAQTFNMGIGMVLAVKKQNVNKVMLALKRQGETAWILGQTLSRVKNCQVQIRQEGHAVTLVY